MISASEMQKGLTIDIEGEPYTVLDWRHDTEGREKEAIITSTQLSQAQPLDECL